MADGVSVKKQFSKWFGDDNEEEQQPQQNEGGHKFTRRTIYEIVQYDIARRQEIDWVRPHPDHNPLGAAYHDALDVVFKIRTSMRRQAQRYRRDQRDKESRQEHQESNS